MTRRRNQTARPTPGTYDPLQYLYDEANAALFDGYLPDCVMTLQRRGKAAGFYLHAKFSKGGGTSADELALNPSYVRDCSTLDLLVVLVHQMLHVWQSHFGKPGRGGYHNRQFAEAAKNIGLFPSSTGGPGGKETGDSVNHYIIEGGAFHLFAQEMERRGAGPDWFEAPEEAAPQKPSGSGAESKSGKRVCYVCPLPHGEKGQPVRLWGKAGISVLCPEHDRILVAG